MIECRHIMLNVSDLAESRAFYIGKLGLPLIEEYPTMFAFRAGGVRFTVAGGGNRHPADGEEAQSATVLLSTPDLETTVAELKGKGVVFDGDVVEAPGFMKHIGLLDPDNNYLYISEYFCDPLEPAST